MLFWRKTAVCILVGLVVLAGLAVEAWAENPRCDYVISISVDGLRASVIEQLGATALPNLYRIRQSGVYTDNARTLYENTVTMPNHVTMLTGRPRDGQAGHGVTVGSDTGTTIHALKGQYVQSVFDVAHDNGLHTGFYAGWDGFDLINRSYGLLYGAPDTTGVNNGTDKIDRYDLVTDNDIESQTTTFLNDQAETPSHFSLLHWHVTDRIGHDYGWYSEEYLDAVEDIDEQLGRLMAWVDADENLAGRTAILLTADHGGCETGHADETDPDVYTVPFYVWLDGEDLGGEELYALNSVTRLDPNDGRPDYSGRQPIRNGELANLALDLLGLESVGGSTFNANQDLLIQTPEPATILSLGLVSLLPARRQRKGNTHRDTKTPHGTVGELF